MKNKLISLILVLILFASIFTVSVSSQSIISDIITISSKQISTSVGFEIAHYGVPVIGEVQKIGGSIYGPITKKGKAGTGSGVGLIYDNTDGGNPSSLSKEYEPIGFARSNLICDDAVTTNVNLSNLGINVGDDFTAVVKMAATGIKKQSNTQNLQTFLDSGTDYEYGDTTRWGLVGGINFGEGNDGIMLTTKEFDNLTTYIDTTYGFEYKRVSLESKANSTSTKICGRTATTLTNDYTGLVIIYGFEVYNSNGIKVWEKSVNDLYHEDLNSFFGTDYEAFWVCESGYEWKNTKGYIFGSTARKNNNHITYSTDYQAEYTLKIDNIIDENEKIATIAFGETTRDLYKTDVQEGYSIYRVGCAQTATTAEVKINVTGNADVKLSNISICKVSGAETVITLIDSISNNISTNSKEKIQNARKYYNELSDKDKAKVTNYDRLIDAENALNTLQGYSNISTIDKAVELINSLEDITVYNLKEKENTLNSIKSLISDLDKKIGVGKYQLSNINKYATALDKASLLDEIYTVAKKIIDLPFGYDYKSKNQNDLNSAYKSFYALTEDKKSRFPDELVCKLNGLMDYSLSLQEKYSLGNVNCDDKNNIDSSDALLALQSAVKKVELNHNQSLAADVNCDGEIAASDALSILQYSVKKIKEFKSLNIFEATGPSGVVYTYSDQAKTFLESGLDDSILKKVSGVKNPDKATTFTFKSNTSDIVGLQLVYSTDPGFCKNVVTVDLEPTQKSIDVYNLYKDSDYYWKVVATKSNGITFKRTGSFITTNLGPRVLSIEGIYNTRDIGGYLTDEGKRTKQGMILRGGALTPDGGFSPNITEKGIKTLTDALGVKTELDLRGTGLNDPPDVTLLPGVNLIYATASGLPAAELRKIFNVFLDETNYPVYMHCIGGADRTGAIASLLNAVLGVDDTNLRIDYSFTTYSIYSYRTCENYGLDLSRYAGSTTKEKAESLILSIGFTMEDIEHFRSLMIENYEIKNN